MTDLVRVTSMHSPKSIDVVGFSIFNEIENMISWLRKGPDVREFIVCDVENELYAQDGGAQLQVIQARGGPECQTKLLKKNEADTEALVSQFTVTFPLDIVVKSSNGDIWRLDVDLTYNAYNMETSTEFGLRLTFTIMGQHAC